MDIQMGTYKIRILLKTNYSELLKVTFRKKNNYDYIGVLQPINEKTHY